MKTVDARIAVLIAPWKDEGRFDAVAVVPRRGGSDYKAMKTAFMNNALPQRYTPLFVTIRVPMPQEKSDPLDLLVDLTGDEPVVQSPYHKAKAKEAGGEQ